MDSTLVIGDEVFEKARVNRRSVKAEEVSRRFAASEELRLNDPALLKLRAEAIATTTEKSLEEVWKLYERRNPEQVKPESMRRTGKWARALLRCRCVGDSKCLAHTLPSRIHLGHAEEFRNARMLECRVCGITESEHPKQTTWKGRKVLTHTHTSVSPRTVFNECGFMLTMIRFAFERSGETGVKAIAITRRPKITQKRGIYPKMKFTPAEYFRIRECFDGIRDGDRYRRIFDFAVATGLRKESLSGFRLEWYDRKNRMLHIPASAMKGRGDSYKPLDVPISAWAASCLQSLERTSGLAWPNPDTGEPQRDFFAVERNLSEKAGLPRKLSLHALRATFCTFLSEHRCDKHQTEVPFFVREKLMGHAIPEQVDAYTDFSASMVEATSVIDCVYRQHIKGTILPMRRRTA